MRPRRWRRNGVVGIVVARELIGVSIASRSERVPVVAGIGIRWVRGRGRRRSRSSSRGEIMTAFWSRTVISAFPERKPQSHLPLGTAGRTEDLELVNPIERRLGPINQGR